MKKIATFLLFFITINCLSEEINKKDSIVVDQLLKQTLKVVYNNPDSARIYCNHAFKNSKEDPYLISKSFIHLGIIYDIISKYDSSIYAYKEALKLSKITKNKNTEASALNNIGLIYWNKSNFELAIDYFNQSIIIFEEIDKKKGIASTLNNIGLIYNELKRYKKAIEYYHNSLKTYQNIENQYGISATYTNLAIAYSHLDKYDSSFYYNRASIIIKESIHDNWGLATNFTNLATNFQTLLMFDSALVYSNKAETLYRNLNNKANLATTLSGKGRILLKLHHYNKSIKALKQAESLAKHLSTKKTLRNVYDHFSTLYNNKEDFKTSLKYLKKRIEIDLEIYNSEKDRTITDIQTKYETVKKDKEIAEKQKLILKQELIVKSKNTQLLIIIILATVLVAITLFIFQKIINKRKKLELQFEAQEKINEANFNKEMAEDKLRISRDLHDNIGSHLTFMITSVDNLAFTEREIIRKEKMNSISEFGRQTMKELRGTIWAMKNDGASLDELLYRVADLKVNIDIPINIVNQIKVDKRLSAIELLNLYRIIQEAIQNTTKHAKASKLTIIFNSNEKEITITIKDNGKGFNVKKESQNNGLKNIQFRSKTINSNLSIESNSNGTTISCHLG